MSEERAAREMTHEEWADMLLSRFLNPQELAMALRCAEDRGARRERDECSAVAHEFANTITEESVALTPLGRLLDEQGCILAAESKRHIAKYVGVLISRRGPQPPNAGVTISGGAASADASLNQLERVNKE